MNRHDSQTQNRSGRDLAVRSRFDSTRKLEPDRTPARNAITQAGVALPAQSALELPWGDMDSPKAREKVHANSIYPDPGKATPNSAYSNLLGYAHSWRMGWNLENFQMAVSRWLAADKSRTKKELAAQIGCGYQHLANVLNGQKRLGKYKQSAANVLDWPNPDFEDPANREIDIQLLLTIYMAVVKTANDERRLMPEAKKITTASKVYNMALDMHFEDERHKTAKVTELVRLALSS